MFVEIPIDDMGNGFGEEDGYGNGFFGGQGVGDGDGEGYGVGHGWAGWADSEGESDSAYPMGKPCQSC